MEYAKLGNTDIEVSKLCIGCHELPEKQVQCMTGHWMRRKARR